MAALRWSMDVKVGEAVSSGSALLGRPRVVTGVSLVRGPPSGHSVVVEAYVKTASGSMELASNLSSERPRAELPHPIMVMTSDLFCSRVRRQGGHSAGDEALVVRFEGRFSSSLPPPPPLVEVSEDEDDDDEDDSSEADEEDDDSVGSEDDDDESIDDEEEVLEEEDHPPWFSDDDDDVDGETDDDDSTSEEDDESDVEIDWQAPMASSASDNAMLQPETLYRRKFVPEGQSDGGPAARFASAGRTIGFMRVEAAERQEEADARQIVVLYRYTRFRASSDGVQRRGRTTEHQLRFIATGGDHTARSLAWAGSCLALLIYRPHSGKRLQKLWSRLASQVSVLPGARRIEVFVDVGILRRADYAAASMRHMCDALLDKVTEPWPKRFTGMELHLPEPVRCGTEGEADDDERPAKRRRVDAAEEDCPVCLQLLEGDDLAAWPGCGKPHVFHGACLEGVLEKNDTCPMCRHKLYI